MKKKNALQRAVRRLIGNRCERCGKADVGVRWFVIPGVQMHETCLDRFSTAGHEEQPRAAPWEDK